MPPAPKPNELRRRMRSPAAWAVAGGVVAMALAVLRFDPTLFTGGDNATYYALAKALSTGAGYVSLYEPGAPPHVLYPPGFPLLLVPFHLVSGGSIVAMKLASLLAGAVVLLAVYGLARRDPAVPGWAAAAAVWTVGLYAVFQTYAHRVMSDLPFTALVVVSLAVLQDPATDDEPADRVDRRWLLGCGLALAAFWTRVPGVTLLAAIVAWALLRRHVKRAATAAAGFALGTLPWFLWSRLRAGGDDGSEYIGQVAGIVEGDAVGEIQSNLIGALEEYGTYQLPHLFWPFDPAPDPVRAVGLVVGAAAIAWGAWRAVRTRGPAVWEVYVPATLAVLPIWPWIGDRFFLTIAPLLWLWILVGLDDASRRAVGGRSPAIGFVGVVCAGLLVAHASGIPDRVERLRAWLDGDRLAGYEPFWRDYFEGAEWMRHHTPEDAVILARKPSLAWYWSRRPVVIDPYWLGEPHRWTEMRKIGVTHVLLEPWSEEHLGETLAAHRDQLTVAFRTESGQVVVLAIAPDPRVR